MLSAPRRAETAKLRAAVLNILCKSLQKQCCSVQDDVAGKTALWPDVAIVAWDPCIHVRGALGANAMLVNREGRHTNRQRQHQATARHYTHTTIMPGRPTSRSTRTSTASATRKSSTGTPRSTRTSHAIDIPDEGPLTSLRTQIAQVFGDAQKTTATQRKLVVNLRKIQEACCFEPPETNKKGGKGREEAHEDFDEEEFNSEVVRCVLRVLGVKKSEPVGDRIIRFLGVFLKHASEKGEQGMITVKDAFANAHQTKLYLHQRQRKKLQRFMRRPAVVSHLRSSHQP
jgi:hypothetical protein